MKLQQISTCYLEICCPAAELPKPFWPHSRLHTISSLYTSRRILQLKIGFLLMDDPFYVSLRRACILLLGVIV